MRILARSGTRRAFQLGRDGEGRDGGARSTGARRARAGRLARPGDLRRARIFSPGAPLLRNRRSTAPGACLPIHDPVSSDVELMIEIERPGHRPGTHGGGEHELKDEDLGTMYVEGEILEDVPHPHRAAPAQHPHESRSAGPIARGSARSAGSTGTPAPVPVRRGAATRAGAALASLKDRLPG